VRKREDLAAFMEDWRRRRAEHESAGDRLMTERDAAIREAYASGVIQADIAEILGISQQLVSRIVRREEGWRGWQGSP
jgi:hypothetical protein